MRKYIKNKSILSFRGIFYCNLEKITKVNEESLINTLTKFFPESQRIFNIFIIKKIFEKKEEKIC